MLHSKIIFKNLCFLLLLGIVFFIILMSADILLNTTRLRRVGFSLWFVTPPVLLTAINAKEILLLDKKVIRSISILYALVSCIITLCTTFLYVLALIADDNLMIFKTLEVLPITIIGTISYCSVGSVITYVLLMIYKRSHTAR